MSHKLETYRILKKYLDKRMHFKILAENINISSGNIIDMTKQLEKTQQMPKKIYI
jgi:hypothetical protein